MKKLRYFTESLDAHEDLHHESQKSLALVGDGHWIRISDKTIFGIAEFAEHQFSLFMQDHPTVVVLPSLHEKKTIKDYLSKKNGGKHVSHLECLRNHCEVVESDTTADIVGKMIEHGHTFLSPER